MSHSIDRGIALVLFLICLAAPGGSQAQRVAHRDVPKGPVTGLEMAVEGSLQAVPGGRLRWFVTVYEIIKGRKLRPAPGTALKVLVSFQRQTPVSEVTTDALGRASIEFDVPDSIGASFNLMVEARSRNGIKRTFDVNTTLSSRYKTELFSDRMNVPPGGELRVWGRIMDLATHSPASKHKVDVMAVTQGNRQLIGNAHELMTDAQGVFHTIVHAPNDSGGFIVNAVPSKAPSASKTISTQKTDSPPLIVYASPRTSVVSPGTTVEVDVVVRTPDGQPVSKATLTGLSIPVSTTKSDGLKPTLTDAKGRARIPWKVQSNSELAEVSGTLQALREGIGVGKTLVKVRSARHPVLVSWSVEGGALIPGLPGRLFVRAFHPDGSPWNSLPIQVRSDQLKAGPTETNRDGVAVLNTTLVAMTTVRDGESSSCHGPTVAALTLTLGTFERELCVPVDPDATMRIRTEPLIRPGTSLKVSFSSVAAVTKSPVVITVLSGLQGHRTPVAQRVVSASKKTAELLIPTDVRGSLLIRARPLIGGELREVRGGTTMAWATLEVNPGHTFSISPSSSGSMQVSSSSGKVRQQTGFAMALSADEGTRLLGELSKARGNAPASGASDLMWFGFLAAHTPTDLAVSSVLQDGYIRTLAMPEDSAGMGLLRDPWRSQARFVRGRLGRLLFALESHVADHVPEGIANVAVRGAKGWRFNSEILSALADELGAEAISGLDGSPLTIRDLQSFDRGIRYDNVARRLTRKRLLNVIVGMRKFVTSEQLDYQWALRGNPRTWMTALLEWDDPEGEFEIDRDLLFDGWGKPFAIRKARGGRARFRFLEPIIGFEIISAGPDGTFDTPDDVFNPFARVLKQSGLYGQAVGEEALLARLRGVELGRATIAALSDVFDVETPDWEFVEMTATNQSWMTPTVLTTTSDVLKVQAVGDSLKSQSAFTVLNSQESTIELSLSAIPRRYMVVAGAFAADGATSFDARPITAGVPLLVVASIPSRLRPNEPLDVPIRVVSLGKHQELHITAIGDGVVTAEVLGKTSFSLQEGEARLLNVRISAKTVGSGRVRFIVKAADGSVIREYQRKLQVMWGGALRAQHDGVWVEKRSSLAFRAPDDAQPIRSFLVVSSPRDLLRDPGFSRVQDTFPAVIAWGYALRGEPIPKSLQAKLASRGYPGDAMITLLKACTATAWNSLEDNRGYKKRRELATVALRVATVPTSMRERSALLVALASSASMFGNTRDRVGMLVNELRNDGWHAPRTEKSRPTVLARLAAGLLLADPNDVPGREMFRLARAALIAGPRGGKQLPGQHGSAVDGWIGTLALAIAARQLGEDVVASELIQGVVHRVYLGMQGDLEPAFWLIAASSYGVFGGESSDVVTATVNGTSHRLELKHGVAVVPLPDAAAKVSVTSDRPVVARLESRYIRPIRKTNQAPISATISGETGSRGVVAALEVRVESTSKEEMARPVIEIALPSSAHLSEVAIQSILNAKGVSYVEKVDSAGVVRIRLKPLGAKEIVRLPLPLEWLASGTVKGLSLTVFDATQPWNISTTPSQTIQLKPAKVETWK